MYSFGRFGLTICAVEYVVVSIEFQHRTRSSLRAVIVRWLKSTTTNTNTYFFRKCASTTGTRPANNEILKFERNKLFVWFVWNADPPSTFKRTELIILSRGYGSQYQLGILNSFIGPQPFRTDFYRISRWHRLYRRNYTHELNTVHTKASATDEKRKQTKK